MNFPYSNQGEEWGNRSFRDSMTLLNGLSLVNKKLDYLVLKYISDGKAETIYQETLKINKKYKGKTFILSSFF